MTRELYFFRQKLPILNADHVVRPLSSSNLNDKNKTKQFSSKMHDLIIHKYVAILYLQHVET